MVNVGKYASPMDPLGFVCAFLGGTDVGKISRSKPHQPFSKSGIFS